MTKVAVIGNAGGGKTTLCLKLSQAKGLPLHEIDRIQWKPGWVRTPPEEIKRKHEAILREDRWIIDGWGGWENIEARLAQADTIIFVDFPLYVHYWWSMKRQFMCLFRPRVGGPEGCPLPPMTWQMMKVIWLVHTQMGPKLAALVHRWRDEKQVFHLRSPNELQRFLNQYG